MFACFKDMPCCMCAVVFLGTPIVQIVILVGLTTAYHCYGCAAQSHLIQWAPWPFVVSSSMVFLGVLLLLIPSVPCPRGSRLSSCGKPSAVEAAVKEAVVATVVFRGGDRV